MEMKIYNLVGRPLTAEETEYLENLINKYLVEVAKTSEGLAVRAFLTGKMMADFAQMGLTAEQIEIATMPLNIRALAQRVGKLTEQERYGIEFARQRSAMNITNMSNRVKAQVRETIWRGLHERKSAQEVASDLFHEFGELNRDWRRIAITEANIAAGEGYMQRLLEEQRIRGKKETKLLGQSAVDACPWCKENIHGKIFHLIPRNEAPLKNLNDPRWDTHLWQGKSNVGRGYAKRKWVINRDGSKILVPRTNAELAKPCFGEHPNGRCWWIPYFEGMPIGKDGYVET